MSPTGSFHNDWSGTLHNHLALPPERTVVARFGLGESERHEGDRPGVPGGLHAIGTALRLHEGETLYVEGDTAVKCYEVVSGLLKESNTLKDGSCHISDFRYPGDLVGITSDETYLHTVEAIEEARLISYPVRQFKAIVTTSPALSEWFARILMADLDRARINGLALSRLSAMERVARFLLTLSRPTTSRGGPDGAFAIPMSRQDIADHLGLTIETVCRCLTTLKHNGLIAMTSAHDFTVRDQAALSALAEREDLGPVGRKGG